MQHICFIALFYLTVGFATAAVTENDTEGEQHLEGALIDLRAADQAWRRNDAEFRAMRTKGKTPETEIHEFAGFVAELQRHVFERCHAVRKLGADPQQYGIECAILDDGAGSKSAPLAKASEALTEQEEAALLMAELGQLEGDFDEMILRKQEELKQRPGRVGSSGAFSGGQSGEPGGISGSRDETQDTVDGGAVNQSGAVQGAGNIEPGAGLGAAKNGKVPRSNVPDGAGTGSDDDVVARQLREAAESESDPVLREQLWVEYKKYKDSTH